ncbi:MAG: alpha/beta fold hydrolase [Eubacterium sp.]|nr:alpha/beta fold hydrolase [Eubacterium sp.]
MKKKKLKKIGVIILAVFAVLMIACIVYVKDYYHSDETVTDFLTGTETVSVTEIGNGLFLDGPGEETAMIFYPGAKVEYTAYLPLFTNLAEQGIDCFLLKMPGNLAVFGKNRADDVLENYEYESWILAGHSLGGAMAASYASEHPKELDGLILLAAYPTKSLTAGQLFVQSIYGSEDWVLNMQKLEDGRQYMPENYSEICINGGNHAGFGAYGEQKGDGKAKINREEQWEKTVDAIRDACLANGIGEEKQSRQYSDMEAVS